jgi:hypothetical protein
MDLLTSNSMSSTCILHTLTAFVLLTHAVAANPNSREEGARPVFRIDLPNPTADKPQSKVWFFRDSWWACLPTLSGNQIWKRSSAGWTPIDDVDSPVRGQFGHGDVYAVQDRAHIVLVSGQALTVVVMDYDEQRAGYVQVAPPTTWPVPTSGSIETATITKDATGCLWVAYDFQQSVWVRASKGPAGAAWTAPILLGSGTSQDDICTITRLHGGIGVIWSNQHKESVLFRFHRNDDSPQEWRQTQIVAQGGRTADDHLNCAVTDDGTLYVATKTSFDQLNRPLLSLRQRLPSGQWQSHPYARLTPNAEPTRPIVMVSSRPKRLVLCHTLYGTGKRNAGVNSINGMICRHPDPDLRSNGVELIQGIPQVNNVTGCKSSLPVNVPAVILASDRQGNVYEAVIDVRDFVPHEER